MIGGNAAVAVIYGAGNGFAGRPALAMKRKYSPVEFGSDVRPTTAKNRRWRRCSIATIDLA